MNAKIATAQCHILECNLVCSMPFSCVNGECHWVAVLQ